MASIPEDPADQFLFFIDNRIVAGEPGGQAIDHGIPALVVPVWASDSAASSAMAAMFDDELFSAAAPVESEPQAVPVATRVAATTPAPDSSSRSASSAPSPRAANSISKSFDGGCQPRSARA